MILSVVVRARHGAQRPLQEYQVHNAEVPAVPFDKITDVFRFLYACFDDLEIEFRIVGK